MIENLDILAIVFIFYELLQNLEAVGKRPDLALLTGLTVNTVALYSAKTLSSFHSIG